MAFIKEPYSESRVEMISEFLKKEASIGNSKDYEIKIDELKVVSRNNNPDRFYEYEEFVMPESRNITIIIHDKSHTSTKYILLLQQEVPNGEELSGIEKNLHIKMQHEKSKWAYNQLQRDYTNLKQQLKECEDYCNQLKDKNHELEVEKSKSSGKLTETVLGLAGTYFANNPDALGRIPIIGNILGGGMHKALSGTDRVNCSCSEAPKEFTGKVYEQDAVRLKKAFIPFFPPEYIEKAMEVVVLFFNDNRFIDQTKAGVEKLIAENRKKQKTAA